MVALCLLAGRRVTIDGDDLRGALRRSELLLAAGGDPRRPLELYGRAVTALASDLDGPGARAQLAAGLAELGHGLSSPHDLTESLDLLAQDADLAWQCYAMALLAEELAAEA
jgi:hypothetical protein